MLASLLDRSKTSPYISNPDTSVPHIIAILPPHPLVPNSMNIMTIHTMFPIVSKAKKVTRSTLAQFPPGLLALLTRELLITYARTKICIAWYFKYPTETYLAPIK